MKSQRIFVKILGLSIGASLLVACKANSDFAGGGKKAPSAAVPTAESFTIGGDGNAKVDLAFFLDTSDSMKEEYSEVIQGLQGFIDRLAAGASGLDYQIFIVGATTKFQVSVRDQSKLDLRNSEVNSHSGMWNAYHFLKGNIDRVPGGNLGLRKDAAKELVFLTDDDATGITAENFLPYLRENQSTLGKVGVSGFVGLPTSKTSPTCKIANVGNSYIALGQDPTFGGQMTDVCESDWNALLSDLAEQVRGRAGRSNIVILKGKPSDAKKIKVLVDGTSFLDFTFDPVKNRLVLDSTKISAGSHKVEVTY